MGLFSRLPLFRENTVAYSTEQRDCNHVAEQFHQGNLALWAPAMFNSLALAIYFQETSTRPTNPPAHSTLSEVNAIPPAR
jgi:hypothetical protein